MNGITSEQLINRIDFEINSNDWSANANIHRDILVVYRSRVYTDLNDILSDELQSSDCIIDKLEEYLRENAELIRSSAFCYTSIPEVDVTLLLCDIAELVAEHKKKKGIDNQCGLKILMPHLEHIHTNTNNDIYPNLDELDLKKVLRSHVLIKDSSYLLPVSYLLESVDGSSENLCSCNTSLTLDKKLPNPYCDTSNYDASDYDLYLELRDIERLENHSDITRELSKVRHELYLQKKGKLTLLSRIYTLIDNLRFSGVLYGTGSEENAGNPVYSAASSFFSYYMDLPISVKDKVPPEVKAALNSFQTLTSDKNANSNATENIETCVESIRSRLIESLVANGNESKLHAIGNCNETISTQLYDRLSSDNEHLSSLLKKIIESGESGKDHTIYSGVDSHHLTIRVLEKLGIALPMEDYRDLQGLIAMDPDSLNEFFDYDEDLASKVIVIIDSLHTLVEFSMECKCSNLSIILNKIRNHVVSLVSNSEIFSEWLTIVGNERSEVICLALRSELNRIISDSRSFNRVLKRLSVDQRNSLCTTMHHDIIKFINDGSSFNSIIEYLTPEIIAVIYEDSKKKLLENINCVQQFRLAIFYLSDDQREELFKMFLDKLPGWINSSNAFQATMEFLNDENRSTLFQIFRDSGSIPDMISSGWDFNSFVCYLSSTQQRDVFHMIDDKFPALFITSLDFRIALTSIGDDLRITIYEKVKNDLPSLISSVEDLYHALFYLGKIQFIELFLAVRKNTNIVSSNSNLASLLKIIDVPQCRWLCGIIKSSIGDYVTDIKSLAVFLESLSPVKCNIFLISVSTFLPKFIKNARDFNVLYSKLSKQNSNVLFEFFKLQLPLYINDLCSFDKIAMQLTRQQLNELYTLLVPRFQNFVTSFKAFSSVAVHFRPSQSLTVLKSSTRFLADIIPSDDEFSWLCFCIKSPDIESFLSHFLDLLTSDDFNLIFNAIKKSNNVSLSSHRTIVPQDVSCATTVLVDKLERFFIGLKRNPRSIEASTWKIFCKYSGNMKDPNLLADIYYASFNASFLGRSSVVNSKQGLFKTSSALLSANDIDFEKAPVDSRRSKIRKVILSEEAKLVSDNGFPKSLDPSSKDSLPARRCNTF